MFALHVNRSPLTRLAKCPLTFLGDFIDPLGNRQCVVSPRNARRNQDSRGAWWHGLRLPDDYRWIHVVCFIRTTLAQQDDRAVRMLLMAVARTWGQAHDRGRRRVSTGTSDHTALIEELCKKRRTMP
jgi:hypothetical protein